MEESVEQYLEQAKARGEVDSEGAFRVDLAEAARKFAQFGQVDQALWTLKLGQCFHALECGRLLIKPTQSRWVLEGLSSKLQLDPVRLKRSLSRLGLAERPQAEDHLAMALSALSASESPLLGARWTGEESHSILGEVSPVRVTPGDQTLVLQFAKGEAPRFPHELWGRQFTYSPMKIALKSASSMIRLNHQGSNSFLREKRPFEFEYLARGRLQQTLKLRPTGHTERELGQELRTHDSELSSRVRWFGLSPIRVDSLTILMSSETTRPTRVFPLVAGCLLEPLAAPSLPAGFTLILNAESCPTDLSQRKLREGPELSLLLSSCVNSLIHLINLALDSVDEAAKGEGRVAKGGVLSLIPVAGCLVAGEPGLGLLFSVPAVLFLWRDLVQAQAEKSSRRTEDLLKVHRARLQEQQPLA